jgi:hypothetical protein
LIAYHFFVVDNPALLPNRETFPDFIADRPNQALIARKPTRNARIAPRRIERAQYSKDLPEGCSLPSLCRLPDQHGERVHEVAVGFRSEVDGPANEIAEGNQELNQDRRRIRFGVRFNRPH